MWRNFSRCLFTCMPGMWAFARRVFPRSILGIEDIFRISSGLRCYRLFFNRIKIKTTFNSNFYRFKVVLFFITIILIFWICIDKITLDACLQKLLFFWNLISKLVFHTSRIIVFIFKRIEGSVIRFFSWFTDMAIGIKGQTQDWEIELLLDF